MMLRSCQAFLGQLCCDAQGLAEINVRVLGTLCLGPTWRCFQQILTDLTIASRHSTPITSDYTISELTIQLVGCSARIAWHVKKYLHER